MGGVFSFFEATDRQPDVLPFGESNFLHHCRDVVERFDGAFHDSTMVVYNWDILGTSAHHKGIKIEPAPTNMIPYFAELHLDAGNGKLAYPVLNCVKHTSCKYVDHARSAFHVSVNQALLHNFAVYYHHHTKPYDLLTHICQTFTWFMLMAHDVPESLLHGIIEVNGGHAPSDIRQAAEVCREQYRRVLISTGIFDFFNEFL